MNLHDVSCMSGGRDIQLQSTNTHSILLGSRWNLVHQDLVSLSFHLHYFSCQSEHFLRKRTISACPGGGTSNLQGGAIYVQDNVKLTISGCTFTSNSAKVVSPFLELLSGLSLTLPQSFFGPSSLFLNGYIRSGDNETWCIRSR